MKRLLQLGFILGFAGALAAAYFTPWFEYQRYRSAASVVANGGRVEQFMVRLPADRLGAPVAPTETGALESSTRLEHFKLRDVEGNIIGLVARHELARGGATETAWLLTIPSRGSIALAARSEADSIDRVLAARGVTAGQALETELSIDNSSSAMSVTATGEFADIDFELVETWVVTGIDEDGLVRGTLLLNTTGRRSS
jgi:hypothetical protein